MDRCPTCGDTHLTFNVLLSFTNGAGEIFTCSNGHTFERPDPDAEDVMAEEEDDLIDRGPEPPEVIQPGADLILHPIVDQMIRVLVEAPVEPVGILSRIERHIARLEDQIGLRSWTPERLADALWDELSPGIYSTSDDRQYYMRFATAALKVLRGEK